MQFQILLILLGFAVFVSSAPTSLESKKDTTTNPDTKNGTTAADEDPFGDRINLNWSTANAVATNETGQFSGVKANSWGVKAGVLNTKTGQYVDLGAQSGGSTQAYSSGAGAPKTWAQGNSKAGAFSATGHATAGFSGGKGVSHSESHSKTEAIKLGGDFVLLSNLNVNKKGKKNKTRPGQKVEAQKPSEETDDTKTTTENINPTVDNAGDDAKETQTNNRNTSGDKLKNTATEDKSNKPENNSSKEIQISFPDKDQQ